MALLILVFALGYIAIVAEHPIRINKTASALITGVLCWVIYNSFVAEHGTEITLEHMKEHLSEIAEILLFLIGAMTIVELIDLHDGFAIITNKINARNTVRLLWIVAWLTFVLSGLLDNLTTTIVMCSLLRKLVHNTNDRKFFAGMIIIAANSGGAFSPIGDLTTTMLWLGGQISATNIIKTLFLPSAVSLLVPLLIVSFILKGKSLPEIKGAEIKRKVKGSKTMLAMGVAALVSVPIFKTVTHLPPYMGMLLGLGVLWALAELIHRKDEEEDTRKYSAVKALTRIDIPSVLFFFGILAAVSALQTAGLLKQLAVFLDDSIGNTDIIVSIIGVASAIIDNVPLVKASMGMYDMSQYPMDSKIWEFMAYAAGTGGSILVIGSAAGVAAMGMEKLDFMWYLKRISFLAFIGYAAGAVTYLLTWSWFAH